MTRTWKSFISLLLVIVFVFQLMPISIIAVEQNRSETSAAETDSEENSIDDSHKKAYIVGEIEDLRDESVKHFRMSDGTYKAVAYNTSVHFQDQEGNWQNIDNTLKQDGSVFKSVNGDMKKAFPTTLADGKLFEMEYQGHKISMTLVSAESNETIAETNAPTDSSQETMIDTDSAEETSSLEAPSAIESAEPAPLDENLEADVQVENENHSALSSAAPADNTSFSVVRAAEVKAKVTNPQTIEKKSGITPDEKMIELDVQRSEISYTDALENTDFVYTNTGYNLKESIIVHSKQNSYAYSFEMNLTNLVPTAQNDGSIILTNLKGDPVFEIPSPYIVDASGNMSDQVSYKLTEANGRYVLSLTADASWMNADDRKFPVTIDPTIIVTSGSNDYKVKTYLLRSNAPGSTPPGYGDQYFGYYNNSSYGVTELAYYLKEMPVIPVNCVIVNAQAGMYQAGFFTSGFDDAYSGYLTAEAHTITGLSDNISNLCYNDVHNSNVTIGDNIIDFKRLDHSTILKYSYWDITSAALNWYEQGTKGWLLFTSPDCQTQSRFANLMDHYFTDAPPMFIMDYRNVVGIEDQYIYEEMDVGRAGKVYLSDFTNTTTIERPVVSLDLANTSFSLTHYYNSCQSGTYFSTDSLAHIHTTNFSNMILGAGWKLSVQQTVVDATIGTRQYLIYTDADGTEHYFFNEGNTYLDEDGLGLTITKTTSGGNTTYTMQDKDAHHTWVFYRGYLVSITDDHQNAYYIAYNGNNYASNSTTWYPNNTGANRITQVVQHASTGSDMTVAALTYDTTNHLASISDFAGKTTTFTYSGAYLTQIQDADGASATYGYAPNGSGDESAMFSIYDGEAKYGLEIGIRWVTVYNRWRMKIDSVQEFTSPTASGTRSYGNGFRPYQHPSHQLTSVRYYGANHKSDEDNNGNDQDDLVVFYALDNYGRAITSYTTNGTKDRILGVTAGSYKENTETEPASNNRLIRTASSGQHVSNLILDSGLEFLLSDSGWNKYGSSSDPEITNAIVESAPFSYDPGHYSGRMVAHTGNAQLKTFITQNTNEYYYSYLRQQVTLASDTVYTFSAYVNTCALHSTSPNNGAFIALMQQDGDIVAESDIIDYFTDHDVENGWERISLTFTCEGGSFYLAVGQRGSTGIAVFDDVQLETNETMSSVNLIQNADFDRAGSTYWDIAAGSIASPPPDNEPNLLQNGNTVKIIGSATEVKHVTQTVKINLPANTTFLISGWGKGGSVYFPIKDDSTTYDRFFGLIAEVKYCDSNDIINSSEYFYIPFCPVYESWQFASGVIAQKSSDPNRVKIAEIKISLAYDKNANDAYFDNISLIREPAETYTYDSKGNPTAATDAGAKTNSEYYDDTSRLKKYTSLTGLEYNLTYGSGHNENDVATVTMGGLTDTTTFSSSNYNPIRERTRVGSSGDYLESNMGYNGRGDLLTSIEDQNGITVSYGYNSAKQQTSVTNGLGTVQHYAYVPLTDRLLQTYVNDVSAVWYGYDNGYLSTMRRKAYSDVTNTQDPFWQKYHIVRDAFGNPTSLTVSKTTQDDINYSSPITLESRAYETSVNGTPVNNGRLSQMTYANGDSVQFSYDLFDRITQKTYNDNEEHHLVYNSEGALSERYVLNAQGQKTDRYTYDYDSLERLIHSKQLDEDGMVQRTDHKYDSANRLTKQSWLYRDNSSFSQNYSYSTANGTLLSISYQAKVGNASSPFTPTISYSYNSLRQLETKTTSGAFVRDFVYKALDNYRVSNLIESTGYTSASTTDLVFDEYYSYDEQGNIILVQDGDVYENSGYRNGKQTIIEKLRQLIRPPAPPEDEGTSYSYDILNQLTTADYYIEGLIWKHHQYDYDSAGNILRKKTNDYQGDYGAGFKTEILYSYANTSWPDLLTGIQVNNSSGTIVYPTDQSGNVTAGTPLTWFNGSHYVFTWKHGTQLASATISSGGCRADAASITYSYDMDGIRSSKTVGTTTYQFTTLNGLLMRQEWSNKRLDFLYDEANQPYAVIYKNGSQSPVLYYYVLNVQGDVVGIMNSSGSLVARYYYDPWGAPTDDEGTSIFEVDTNSEIGNINPLRYRGYYYDSETGFYYLQSRYYDPFIGRFISADTFASTNADGLLSCNMFAYCENNPVSGIDPTGQFFFTALGAITGFVGSGIVALIAGENAENIMRIALAGAFGGAIAGAGVDIGLLIIGSGGLAAPLAAGAVAWAFGGTGNLLATNASARITNTELDYSQKMMSFALGGLMNLFSLATGLDAAAKSVSMIAYKGMSSFDNNLTTGLLIGSSTAFATNIAIAKPSSIHYYSVSGGASPSTWRTTMMIQEIK